MLPVELHFNAVGNYEANRGCVMAVLSALATSPGRLIWTDDSGATVYLDREVMVAGHNLPEDPNQQLGADYQAVKLTFAFWQTVDARPVTTSYQAAGSLSAQSLGEVLDFRSGIQVDRASEYHDDRIRTAGNVSMAGKIVPPDGLALDDRRSWLQAAHAALESAMSSKSGVLLHGAFFNRSVRVTGFEAVINQAEWQIDWSLQATFTRFPDESAFVTSRFQTATTESKEGGTFLLRLSGSIGSESESHARSALAALQSTYTSGFTLLEAQIDPKRVEAGDGTTFVELTFDMAYRKSVGNLVGERLAIEDGDEVTEGMIHRTYSGSVTMKASTWDLGYQFAAARARALGADKHPFQLRGRVSVVDPQLGTPNYSGQATRVTTGDVVVTVQFSYEYQIRGARTFVRLQAERSTEAFGTNSLSVSGSVAAPDASTARSVYQALRALYVTTFIRAERTTEQTEQVDALTGVPVGVTRTPAPPRSWGTAVNGSETASGGFASQFVKLEFSFSQLVEKQAGAEIAIRYRIETDVDILTRRAVVTLTGEAFGQGEGDTEWAIGRVVASVSPSGARVKYGRGAAREKWLGNRLDSTDDRPAGAGYLMGVSFSETYDGVAPVEAGILECEVSEQIRLSGPRVVPLPSAFGRDVVQYCGIASGERTIRGFATAASEATARAFAQSVRSMTLPSDVEVGDRFAYPPEIGTDFVMPPRVAMTGRGGGARIARVTFTFREVMP
jgi:hypothetical protein